MALEASEPSAPTTSEPQAASWIAVDAADGVGLAGLRAHLDRVVSRLGLRSLTVVVDDPDLGRQAFRAGSGTVEPGAISTGAGVLTDPTVTPGALDAPLLVALCAASLRVDVLRDTADATGELVLRRLPGVFAVELEDDGDLTICRVHIGDEAPDDIGRVAARALPASAGSRLVVEVVRVVPAAPPPVVENPAVVTPTAPPESPATSATATAAVPTPPISLLAVRSVPEDGEVEVHLGLGAARAVGRAPLSRGLAGAAEAVLAAASQVAALTRWRPTWIRTVETTADGQFVVAAALVDPDADEHRHGIATGSSPIEAAARATVGALAEP